MSDKQKIISADDLAFMRSARIQVSQAVENLKASKAAQSFVEQNIAAKYGITATDSVNLETGEILRAAGNKSAGKKRGK